ncbi:unnamed protein product [Leptidea sinapis]|uniref:Uncharacterized protein n=1 Tax=Leptidea sinapis TaxID=189913 RepID=A0A5E4R589_9NEOP|nr:unnamed protein product [Leptidea sinapis]
MVISYAIYLIQPYWIFILSFAIVYTVYIHLRYNSQHVTYTNSVCRVNGWEGRTQNVCLNSWWMTIV